MPDAPAQTDDHAIAAQLARDAGNLLLELRERRGNAGVSGKALGREGDAASHQLVMKRLAELRPDDAVLSEEGLDQDATRARRLAAPRVWIIDPLDGTREFGEVPRTDWAVHVALTIDGDAAIGAVALPGRDLILTTRPESGSAEILSQPFGDSEPEATPAHLPSSGDGQPNRIVTTQPPRIVVSRSRPPAAAERIAAALGGELVPLGSAGAKAMAVVLGEADVYAHSGGQYEWDSAAPVAVARAVGLHVSRLDGSPLVYNQPDPYLPDLLVCRRDLAGQVIAAAAAH